VKQLPKVSFLIVFLSALLLVITVNLGAANNNGNSYAPVTGIEINSDMYKDGIYYGEAQGFRPGIRIRIEISGGRLVSVDIIEHNEIGRQYWSLPVKALPEEMITRQSTDIDTVSGATATSYGILAAVENALARAVRMDENS